MFALIILLKICISHITLLGSQSFIFYFATTVVCVHKGLNPFYLFLFLFCDRSIVFKKENVYIFLIFLPSLSPWVTDIPANKSNPPTRSQLEINVLFFTVFFIYLLAQQQYSTHRTVLWMFAITFTIYVLLTLISGALDFKLQLWFKTILHHDALR